MPFFWLFWLKPRERKEKVRPVSCLNSFISAVFWGHLYRGSLWFIHYKLNRLLTLFKFIFFFFLGGGCFLICVKWLHWIFMDFNCCSQGCITFSRLHQAYSNDRHPMLFPSGCVACGSDFLRIFNKCLNVLLNQLTYIAGSTHIFKGLYLGKCLSAWMNWNL